jgi:Immunity protein 43
MNDLFIWFYTVARIPKGALLGLDVMLRENFYPNKKQDDFVYPWCSYNPIKDGFPVSQEALRFPKELFFIVDDVKELNFDFIPFQSNMIIVSEIFLNYLKAQHLEANFEVAFLKVVDINEKIVKCNKQYFALRIGKFDDEFFDFDVETKKRAAGSRDFFLYPNMKLKKTDIGRDVFFLNELWYRNALLLTKAGKDRIKSDFYLPEIYMIEEFPIVYNNRTKEELLPSAQ